MSRIAYRNEKMNRQSSDEEATILEESSEATEVYDAEMWQPDGEDSDSPVYVPAEYTGWRSPVYQQIPSCLDGPPTSPPGQPTDAFNLMASPRRTQGIFLEPTTVLDDGSNEDVQVLYETEPKCLNENCDLSRAEKEASSIFACAADAVKAAGVIIQNAIEQDSVMRRERHKLQMDVLLLKKAKLKKDLTTTSKEVLSPQPPPVLSLKAFLELAVAAGLISL
ncbi:hypothetical protein HPB52_000507 [Rhipicephalus sanguineus]|uniref:Uncharacterized protein n=1 Tax=Rhipicephalus sanguineus TaxID=34632 RepID=A0A9D4PBS2_RHISA|nr:hypothetical protein HPB52_000507 [Rhipicephalus sanguineus]